MTAGRFIAVVGPSGAGKDSVIAGLCDACPHLIRVRRAITRPETAGGEPHLAVNVATFTQARAAGDYLLDWGAHGLFYGIPATVLDDLRAGAEVIGNLSRSVLALAQIRLKHLVVVHVTASQASLTSRLGLRGREGQADIAARLARAGADWPPGLIVYTIANDGALADTIAAARAALYPVSA